MQKVIGLRLEDGTTIPFEDVRIPAPPAEGNAVLVVVDGEVKWLPKEE